jgi:dethiobiotin synthase
VARGLFVTGTDTGVGKTVVSAALVALYRARGPVRYWKPIQTGVDPAAAPGAEDDTALVARLARCTAGEVLDDGVRLPLPISPHLAAEAAGHSLALGSIVEPIGRPPHRPDVTGPFWIVEGAGGVNVPINDEHMMIDVIAILGLPAVVVARTAVGTINHTLLTLEALRRRSLGIAAVIMSGTPDRGARDTIARRGGLPIVELPLLAPLTPDAIERWAAAASASWPI